MSVWHQESALVHTNTLPAALLLLQPPQQQPLLLRNRHHDPLLWPDDSSQNPLPAAAESATAATTTIKCKGAYADLQHITYNVRSGAVNCSGRCRYFISSINEEYNTTRRQKRQYSSISNSSTHSSGQSRNSNTAAPAESEKDLPRRAAATAHDSGQRQRSAQSINRSTKGSSILEPGLLLVFSTFAKGVCLSLVILSTSKMFRLFKSRCTTGGCDACR